MFRKNLDKILIGQHITTGPPTYTMTRSILEGAALAKFEDATTSRGTETMEHFGQVLDDMGNYVFPRRALQLEKTLHEALHAKTPQLEDARVHGKSGRTQ